MKPENKKDFTGELCPDCKEPLMKVNSKNPEENLYYCPYEECAEIFSGEYLSFFTTITPLYDNQSENETRE